MKLSPMLAEPAAHPPAGDGWRYEPKYDGMRALAFVGAEAVALVSRGAHERTRQFPEVAEALRELRAGVGCDLALDGELVAGDEHGYEGFRALQGRISLEDPFRIRLRARSRPCSLVCFDLLIHAGNVLVGAPLEERRARLEDVLAAHGGARVRLAEQSADLEGTVARAYAEGWEGIVAKQRGSPYRSGERSPAWRKWKPSLRQEFVVVGWTESERREHLGALLLGYYEDGALRYAGRVGSGFSRRALAEVAATIRPFERSICPLDRLPDLAERQRWLNPRVVAEVRFDAWSAEGHLRFPRFVALRRDRDAHEVRREEPPRATGG